MNRQEQNFVDRFESFRCGEIVAIPHYELDQWLNKHMDYDHYDRYLDDRFNVVGDHLRIRWTEHDTEDPIATGQYGTIELPIRRSVATEDIDLFFLMYAGQGETTSYLNDHYAIVEGIRAYWFEVNPTIDAVHNDLEQGLREAGLLPRYLVESDKMVIYAYAQRCVDVLESL